MSDGTDCVRLLPGTGLHGRTALLVTDGDGPVSRLADHMEAAQLGLGERLLDRARQVLEEQRPMTGEPRLLAGQLTEALADALLIAESRGAHLGEPVPGPADGTQPALLAYGLLTLPGRDLASARTARHYVRDTCRFWRVPSATTDNLVTITGELAANALEHTDTHTVTITCTLTAEAATVGATDDGRSGGTPMIPALAGSSEAERESGRGLLITEALAARRGTRRAGGGLTVWAEVAIG